MNDNILAFRQILLSIDAGVHYLLFIWTLAVALKLVDFLRRKP